MANVSFSLSGGGGALPSSGRAMRVPLAARVRAQVRGIPGALKPIREAGGAMRAAA